MPLDVPSSIRDANWRKSALLSVVKFIRISSLCTQQASMMLKCHVPPCSRFRSEIKMKIISTNTHAFKLQSFILYQSYSFIECNRRNQHWDLSNLSMPLKSFSIFQRICDNGCTNDWFLKRLESQETSFSAPTSHNGDYNAIFITI